jgi:hypothetical protein
MPEIKTESANSKSQGARLEIHFGPMPVLNCLATADHARETLCFNLASDAMTTAHGASICFGKLAIGAGTRAEPVKILDQDEIANSGGAPARTEAPGVTVAPASVTSNPSTDAIRKDAATNTIELAASTTFAEKEIINVENSSAVSNCEIKPNALTRSTSSVKSDTTKATTAAKDVKQEKEAASSPVLFTSLLRPPTQDSLTHDISDTRTHTNEALALIKETKMSDLNTNGATANMNPATLNTLDGNADPSWHIPRWHALQQKRLALCQMRVQLEQQLYEQTLLEETIGKQLIDSGLAVVDDDLDRVIETKEKNNAYSTWLKAWNGRWEKGLPHGLGTLELLNGQVYKGQVANGQRHGTGRNVWPNGQVYSGSWHMNSRHGRGTHRWPDGRTVTGMWHQGHLHGGRCFFQWPDGATYDGDCWQGQKHGRGVHTWADGRIYGGTYQQGREHGFGSLTEADGICKYRGQFENGGRHGYGLQIWKHKTYDGQWRDNAVNGNGKLSWNTGASYVGQFDNGKYHGEGTFQDANGGRYTGSWKRGEKWGFGQQSWPNGKSYQGHFVRGKRHGYGRLNYKDQSIYVGTWKNGQRHGSGMYITNQGSVGHCGQWKRDKPVTGYRIRRSKDDISTPHRAKRVHAPARTSLDDIDALTYVSSNKPLMPLQSLKPLQQSKSNNKSNVNKAAPANTIANNSSVKSTNKSSKKKATNSRLMEV